MLPDPGLKAGVPSQHLHSEHSELVLDGAHLPQAATSLGPDHEPSRQRVSRPAHLVDHSPDGGVLVDQHLASPRPSHVSVRARAQTAGVGGGRAPAQSRA